MARRKLYYYNIHDFRGTAKDFEERYGIPAEIFRNRVDQLGWDVGRAIHEPVQESARWTSEFNYTCHDYIGSLPMIAKHFNIDYSILLKELNGNRSQKIIENAVDKLISLKEQKELVILTKNENLNSYKEKIDNNEPMQINTKKGIHEVLKANLENNTVYNPILDWCLENHKDYNVIMNRIANKGMTFEEAREIPMKVVNTKNLVYKKSIGNMKTFCNRYKLNFEEVYELSKQLYDFEYIIDTLRKKNKSKKGA